MKAIIKISIHEICDIYVGRVVVDACHLYCKVLANSCTHLIPDTYLQLQDEHTFNQMVSFV